MNENLVDRCVAIVGLGLMGGSYAKALKRRGVKRILAFDADQRTLENGLADGCVDEIYTTGGTVLRDAALINCEAMDEATKYFIAGSFRDGTRVANINAPLWRDLLLSNRENVLHEITAFQQTLGHFAKLLEAKDGARLKAFLEEASRRRRDLLHE